MSLCVNALSSEGVEEENSGQGGLRGGLLSASMCITSLLATNRPVLLDNILMESFWEGETGITNCDLITNHCSAHHPNQEEVLEQC